MSKLYQQSGVSLKAGYESVELIKKHVQRTGMVSMFGNFGGVFDLSELGYEEPVLVSGTDGVGTKLELAFAMDKHDTIGIDLVAMCVNDVLAQGARPLYFLDYIATGKNYPKKIEQIVKGIADGCIDAGCSLIGGETAEMPDIYKEDHYDLAGFTVGCVEKKKLIDGSKVKSGNKIIGLASSGVHSNGFSLVRKILFKDNDYDINKVYPNFTKPLGEVLLEPTKIYVKSVLNIIDKFNVNGIAHITGGGFDENIPRVLTDGLGVKINKESFEILPIFKFLQEVGNVDEAEMFNVFNMGIGMMMIVEEHLADSILAELKSSGEKAYLIGEVTNEPGVCLI